MKFKDSISPKNRNSCFFTAMETMEFKEPLIFEPFTGEQLDTLFYSYYKNRSVSDLITDAITDTVLDNNDINTIASILYNSFCDNWRNIKKALNADIPVEGETKSTETESLQTTGSNKYNRSQSDSSDVYGFDSETSVNDKDVTSSENSSNDSTAGKERTLTRVTNSGNYNNLNVVNKMLNTYKYDFVKHIFNDVSEILFTANYDDE